MDALLVANEVVYDLLFRNRKESYANLIWRKHMIT